MTATPTVIVAVVSAFLASSGFWAYLIQRKDKTSASTRLLMGLAHDKILFLGMRHIDAGYISREDYDDLRLYLWDPYKELGGNGTVDRVMKEVTKLPFRMNKATFHIQIPNPNNEERDVDD